VLGLFGFDGAWNLVINGKTSEPPGIASTFIGWNILMISGFLLVSKSALRIIRSNRTGRTPLLAASAVYLIGMFAQIVFGSNPPPRPIADLFSILIALVAIVIIRLELQRNNQDEKRT
jgi:hypothetical protein